MTTTRSRRSPRSTSPTTSSRRTNGLLLTEDPGSSQQFPAGDTIAERDHGAALVRPVRAARRPRSSPTSTSPPTAGPTDVDGRAAGNQGAWESTGIVDASAAFGRGAFLVNVQAHTLWVEKAPGDDNNGDGQPDFTYKREGGQLALIRIPGL